MKNPEQWFITRLPKYKRDKNSLNSNHSNFHKKLFKHAYRKHHFKFTLDFEEILRKLRINLFKYGDDIEYIIVHKKSPHYRYLKSILPKGSKTMKTIPVGELWLDWLVK